MGSEGVTTKSRGSEPEFKSRLPRRQGASVWATRAQCAPPGKKAQATLPPELWRREHSRLWADWAWRPAGSPVAQGWNVRHPRTGCRGGARGGTRASRAQPQGRLRVAVAPGAPAAGSPSSRDVTAAKRMRQDDPPARQRRRSTRPRKAPAKTRRRGVEQAARAGQAVDARHAGARRGSAAAATRARPLQVCVRVAGGSHGVLPRRGARCPPRSSAQGGCVVRAALSTRRWIS